jgi:hypothetical protein
VDSSEKSARGLWESLLPIYRQCAVSCTNFLAAYGMIFLSKLHRAVGKESGRTNHIEAIELYVSAAYLSISEKNLIIF